MSDSEHTLEQGESDATFKDLTCSICWGPHSTDNLMCAVCGQAWHTTCLVTVTKCPNCRSEKGFVPPRPYNELIKIISNKLVRCDYCNLAFAPAEYPQQHLSHCEAHKSHQLQKIFQQRRVFAKAEKLKIPQEPLRINPTRKLNVFVTIIIPDLRQAKQPIAVKLELKKLPEPRLFSLQIKPVECERFPLRLSILFEDSEGIHPLFNKIPDFENELIIPITLNEDDSILLWINAL